MVVSSKGGTVPRKNPQHRKIEATRASLPAHARHMLFGSRHKPVASELTSLSPVESPCLTSPLARGRYHASPQQNLAGRAARHFQQRTQIQWSNVPAHIPNPAPDASRLHYVLFGSREPLPLGAASGPLSEGRAIQRPRVKR